MEVKKVYKVDGSVVSADLPNCIVVKNTGSYEAEISVVGQLQSVSSLIELKIFKRSKEGENEKKSVETYWKESQKSEDPDLLGYKEKIKVSKSAFNRSRSFQASASSSL